jgi:hypothetical protein
MNFSKQLVGRLNCKVLDVASEGAYTGCQYYLLKKDNKFSIVQYHYGTCELCDAAMGLEADYQEANGYCSVYPESVYEPIIKDLAKQVEWLDKDALRAKFHMIFGVGYMDREIQDHFNKLLDGN